jgi:hypothetical protein
VLSNYKDFNVIRFYDYFKFTNRFDAEMNLKKAIKKVGRVAKRDYDLSDLMSRLKKR